MRKVIFAVVIFLSSWMSAVIASDPITQKGTISRLYLQPSGNVLFQINQTNGCVPVSGNFYYSLEKSKVDFSENYSLLLAAAYSKKSITIRMAHRDFCESSDFSEPLQYITQEF